MKKRKWFCVCARERAQKPELTDTCTMRTECCINKSIHRTYSIWIRWLGILRAHKSLCDVLCVFVYVNACVTPAQWTIHKFRYASGRQIREEEISHMSHGYAWISSLILSLFLAYILYQFVGKSGFKRIPSSFLPLDGIPRATWHPVKNQ